MSTVKTIAIENLTLSTNYVRSVVSDTEIFAIAEALEAGAVMPPLAVYPTKGGKFIVFDGAKRLQASEIAGLSEVECLVYANAGKWSAAEIISAVTMNTGRQDLHILEIAEAACRLGAEEGLSIAQVGKLFGKDEGTLNNACSLNRKLTATVREKILLGEVSYSAALECVGLGAEELNATILQAIAEGKTTQKAMRERAKAAKGEPSPKAKPAAEGASAPSEGKLDTELEAALKLILGASVVVDAGKGVIQAHNVNRTRVLELAKMISKPSVAAATVSAMA